MKTSFKIPVVYTGYVGRTRTPRTVVGLVEHTFDIPELDVSEAPLVFRCVHHGGMEIFVDYRLHEGRLYRWLNRTKTDGDYQVRNRLQGMRQSIWENMAAHVKERTGPITPAKSGFIPLPKDVSLDALEELLVREAADARPSENAGEEIEAWRLRADDTVARGIVIHDRMYELAEEPMYAVSFEKPLKVDWANPFKGSLSGCPYDDIMTRYVNAEIHPRDQIQSKAYFNPDQLEEAQELLGRLNPAAGNQLPAVTIERHLDEYQCRDMPALELDRAARLLLNDVSWGISLRSRNRPILLEDESSEMVRAVMHLHRLVNSATAEDGPHAGLDDAMNAVMDTAVGGIRDRPVLRPHIRERVGYAIERWQDRPITSLGPRRLGPPL